MKIKTFIFTYDRKDMLTELVTLLNSYGITPIILDDGSTYEHEFNHYFRHEHRGKEGFYKTWLEALKMCEKSEAELYLFLTDDMQDLDVSRILEKHKEKRGNKYAYNILNVGFDKMWLPVVPIPLGDEIRVGFVDCGFFCNREALEAIKFTFEPRLDWNYNSSGVGYALSKAFFDSPVFCYIPIKSMAYHGDHESKMHPDERKQNPLISK